MPQLGSRPADDQSVLALCLNSTSPAAKLQRKFELDDSARIHKRPLLAGREQPGRVGVYVDYTHL